MTAGQLLAQGVRTLESQPDARWDARALLADALNAEPTALARRLTEEVSPEAEATFRAGLERRAAGEPLQYILGKAWFMGLCFAVDARVLIPRQDTELLCEEALAFAGRTGARRGLDLCTGSGALAVALAHLGGLEMTAADLSGEALCVARKNACALGAQVRFFQGDLFGALPPGERYPLIVCNPPYLTEAEMRVLQPEVRREPALALLGGEDGLDFYRRLRQEAGPYLEEGGQLMMEIGSAQGTSVAELFAGWNPRVLRDLNGCDRVVVAEKPKL